MEAPTWRWAPLLLLALYATLDFLAQYLLAATPLVTVLPPDVRDFMKVSKQVALAQSPMSNLWTTDDIWEHVLKDSGSLVPDCGLGSQAAVCSFDWYILTCKPCVPQTDVRLGLMTCNCRLCADIKSLLSPEWISGPQLYQAEHLWACAPVHH